MCRCGADIAAAVGNIYPLALLNPREKSAAMPAATWRMSGTGMAAQLLGMKPTTLTYRPKALGLHPRSTDRVCVLTSRRCDPSRRE